MTHDFSFSHFLLRFSDDAICLEEIKKVRFQNGIICTQCNKKRTHYKISGRTAYACNVCRKQMFPLTGTIFEKTSTPLRIWFYAMFLMTYTRATISIKQLQRELGVTYKTAWRMYTSIKILMAQNNGDLLVIPVESNVLKWTFFNRFEIKVVEKEETTE